MAITVNSTVALGAASIVDRFYRITAVGHPMPEYSTGTTRIFRTVTVVKVSDGTTWEVRVKSGAKFIPWNVTLRRVLTEADRERAMREELARVAKEWPYLTHVRVGNRFGVVKCNSKWLDRVTVSYEDGGMGDPLISMLERVN